MALYGPALVDIVGLNNIEVTSGVLMVFKGLANLTLHSLAGPLIDATMETNIPFYVFGSTQVLGGLIVMLVPMIQRHIHRQDMSDIDSDIEVLTGSDSSRETIKVPPNDIINSMSSMKYPPFSKELLTLPRTSSLILYESNGSTLNMMGI